MGSSGIADDGDGCDCFLQGLGYRVGGGVLIEVQVGLLGRWARCRQGRSANCSSCAIVERDLERIIKFPV